MGNPGQPESGYSFCIISDGKEPAKTDLEIRSIQRLNIPAYEIMLGGITGPISVSPEVIKIELAEQALAGRLGAMRNELCRRARYDHLIVVDDDFIFHEDFYTGLLRYGEDYDVLSCRILNPNGTRYWDWKTYKNGVNTLLSYEESSPWISLSGGLCIMKSWVFQRVQWDPSRRFYQKEDVLFSDQLKTRGIRIAFNPYSTITHDDEGYIQVGEHVRKMSHAELWARKRWICLFGKRDHARA